jgi:hypothetical protein
VRSGRPRAVLALATATVALAVATLAVSAPALAAQSRVTTAIDTTYATVGDRIGLTVTVEHPGGTTVAWPDSLSLAPFEVLDARLEPTRSANAGSASTLHLSLAAFELGNLEIPSFEVSVVGADGTVAEVLETDRWGVEVASVGADETGDIREIRGPFAIPLGPLWIVLTLLLLLVPALLAWLLYRRRRGRGADGDAMGLRGPPPRPAHELALEALAALEGSPMLERGQVKEFHIEAAEILRTYVERRFRVDALEMTTREVLAGLERAGVDDELGDALRRFLEQCDLVKFAKVRPTAEASRELLALGRWVVERTIPTVVIPDVDVEADVVGRDAELDVGVGAGAAGSASDHDGPHAPSEAR